MKFVIIPDSFKGSMSSAVAAAAIARGTLRADPGAQTVCLPVADGGEGTVDVLESLGVGRTIHVEATGPMGEPVRAKYILTSGGEALIEMAQASGLTLIAPGRRDPMRATSFGTGEIIASALSHGAKSITLFVGGSATNDGGTGMAQALGASFMDEYGQEIARGCVGLAELKTIDVSRMKQLLRGVEIIVACDVNNPLCGKDGASAVYGPQKGARADTVREMDALLEKLARVMERMTAMELRGIPGTGAAGGIALPLLAFAGASIVSGINTVLDCIGFERHLAGADYVLTGEGRIDGQTPCGKVIAGVLKAAAGRNVPVVAFAGQLGAGYDAVLEEGLASCFCILPGALTLEDAMKNGAAYLEDCAERVVRLLVPKG